MVAIELIKSERVIEAWKPEPLGRMSDGGGLYLLAAKEKGRRHAWRLDYTFEMVRKTISLGVYPNVSLKLARQKAREAQMVAAGINPSAERQQKKAAIAVQREAERRVLAGEVPKDCFEEVARRWYATREVDWVRGWFG